MCEEKKNLFLEMIAFVQWMDTYIKRIRFSILIANTCRHQKEVNDLFHQAPNKSLRTEFKIQHFTG
jgi:hypothetical protein